MNRMDFNCYCGNWPFFRMRCNTLQKLTELHRRCGISGGFVSSCEAIFYQDPYEAEEMLAKELAGTSYMHTMTLNPMLPSWKDDLKRAVEKLNIRAVRLMPGFHDYSLMNPVLDSVCNELRTYHLPLLLTLRIRDERTAWIFSPKSVPLEDVAAFLDRNKDILTLLACTRNAETIKLRAQFEGRRNLFTDVSGLKNSNFAVESACEAIGKEHIVYGSSAPLLELQSTMIIVEKANLDECTRNDILGGKHLLTLLEA